MHTHAMNEPHIVITLLHRFRRSLLAILAVATIRLAVVILTLFPALPDHWKELAAARVPAMFNGVVGGIIFGVLFTIIWRDARPIIFAWLRFGEYRSDYLNNSIVFRDFRFDKGRLNAVSPWLDFHAAIFNGTSLAINALGAGGSARVAGAEFHSHIQLNVGLTETRAEHGETLHLTLSIPLTPPVAEFVLKFEAFK